MTTESVSTLEVDGQRRRLLGLARGRRLSHQSRRTSSNELLQLRRNSRAQFGKPWHHEVLRRHVLGQDLKDIAVVVGRSYGNVLSVSRTEAFQQAKRELLGQVWQGFLRRAVNDPVFARIVDEGPRSLDALIAMRDHSADDAVRVRAASNLLDRYEALAKDAPMDRDGGIMVNDAVIDAMAIALQVTLTHQPDATVEEKMSAPLCPAD